MSRDDHLSLLQIDDSRHPSNVDSTGKPMTTKDLGFVTIRGERIVVRKPLLGVVLDRIGAKEPSTALTIHALCINKSEEWLRNLDIEEAAILFELTTPIVTIFQKIARGAAGAQSLTDQQH